MPLARKDDWMIKLNRFNQATELAQRKLEKLYDDEICTTEQVEPIEKAVSMMRFEHDAAMQELTTANAALAEQSATIAQLRQSLRQRDELLQTQGETTERYAFTLEAIKAATEEIMKLPETTSDTERSEKFGEIILSVWKQSRNALQETHEQGDKEALNEGETEWKFIKSEYYEGAEIQSEVYSIWEISIVDALNWMASDRKADFVKDWIINGSEYQPE